LEQTTLVAGFQDTLIIAAIFCTIAVITSLARGGSKPVT